MNSKAEKITNESDIDDVFELSCTAIIQNMQKLFGKGLGWIIVSVVNYTIDISEYNPLAGSSYIKLPEESGHPKIGSMNIQNIVNNKCFIWCLIRYLRSLLKS